MGTQPNNQHSATIGQNVRRIRIGRGLSLSALSEQSGVARGTLHQLEAGAGNPRMDTLYALAGVLGVALSDLVAAGEPDRTLIRATEGVSVGTAGLNARFLRRFSLVGGLLELSDLWIADGCHVVNDAHLPGIYEHVLIAKGVLRTGPVDTEEVLRPGDYMRFRGDRPHRYEVLDGPVIGTLLMEYPSGVGAHGNDAADSE